MDKYKAYMDRGDPSPELRARLAELKPEKGQPIWKKYAAMAAALVLILGLGVWGMGGLPLDGGQQEIGAPVPEPEESVSRQEEPAVVPVPQPNPLSEGYDGYEVWDGESVRYFMLPRIRYGWAEEEPMADTVLPVGTYRRDLTREELLALLDGEENLIRHLNWGDYTLYAFAMLNRDGSLWELYVEGRKEDGARFTLQICPGRLPATCFPLAKSEVNEIWGVQVEAEASDGPSGSSRRVAFLHGDYGYRFRATGSDSRTVEEMVARAVRFFLQDCAPWFVSEGNWESVSTEPYDPSAPGEQPAQTPPEAGN